MDVGYNNQNHLKRSPAAMHTNSFENNGECDLLNKTIGSMSIKDEVARKLNFLTDDKENSSLNCNEYQENVQRSLNVLQELNREEKCVDSRDVQHKNSAPRGHSNPIAHDSALKAIPNDMTSISASNDLRIKIKLENELVAFAGIDDRYKSYEKDSNTPQSSPLPLMLGSLDGNHGIKPITSGNTIERRTQSLEATPLPSKKPTNIAYKYDWSTKKPGSYKSTIQNFKTKDAKILEKPPSAYNFKDVYARKKQIALKNLLEEERKKRIFHSRPAPNFSVFHKQIEENQVKHAVTVPVTPKVLKHSNEKRRKRLEECKKTSLNENLLMFKKSPRPFNLRTESRLQERRKYDEATKLALMEKQKKEEEKLKAEDEERIKQLRKQATFKARPNPFK